MSESTTESGLIDECLHPVPLDTLLTITKKTIINTYVSRGTLVRFSTRESPRAKVVAWLVHAPSLGRMIQNNVPITLNDKQYNTKQIGKVLLLTRNMEDDEKLDKLLRQRAYLDMMVGDDKVTRCHIRQGNKEVIGLVLVDKVVKKFKEIA